MTKKAIPAEHVILQEPGVFPGISYYSKGDAAKAYKQAKQTHSQDEDLLGAVCHLYHSAEVICERLHIPVPNITIIPNGLVVTDPENPETEPEDVMALTISGDDVPELNGDLIIISGAFPAEVRVGVLARELRMKWQSTHPDQLSYPAEVDADGFAVAWMHARTHYPWRELASAIAPEADFAGLSERVCAGQDLYKALHAEAKRTVAKHAIVGILVLAAIVIGMLLVSVTPQDEAVKEMASIAAELTADGWAKVENESEKEYYWQEAEKVVLTNYPDSCLPSSLDDVFILRKGSRIDEIFYIENSYLGLVKSFEVQQVFFRERGDSLEYDTWYFQ